VLVGGWEVLHVSPHPAIDVWTLQQAGAGELTQGHNPYSAVAVPDTGPRSGLVPYTYPPLQLYATLPAYMIGGDVRYAMLGAVVLTGVALRMLTRRVADLPSLAQDAPALVIWLTPKLFLIIEQAWVDPVGLALLCLAVWAQVSRRFSLAALLFGLAFAAKQTMFWLIPLGGVLLRFSRSQWLLAGGAIAATVLPLALWDLTSWYRANITFLLERPPRMDGLTLTTWYYWRTGHPPVGWPGLLAAVVLVAIVIVRLPRSAGTFTASAAATYGLFFALSDSAFANYYYLVLGLAALAAATALSAGADATIRRT